jgi:hypothetical protein
MTNCIQCDNDIICLSDDELSKLTEEELDKYLKCDESFLKPNQVERQQINTKRVRLHVPAERGQ